MAQIICRDLAIGYEGKTVVQNINLSVKKGDYLCVIGENGAGKSTFMKTLLGLLSPVSGKIELFSPDVRITLASGRFTVQKKKNTQKI